MSDIKVGKITHYYDKISVAVLDVQSTLKVGDRIKILTNEGEFEMTIDSMQIEHEKITSAKKGQQIGLKVTQPVKPGNEVFKIS